MVETVFTAIPDDTYAEWWNGGMAEWQRGYIPNLSCYIYGTRRQQHRHLLIIF